MPTFQGINQGGLGRQLSRVCNVQPSFKARSQHSKNGMLLMIAASKEISSSCLISWTYVQEKLGANPFDTNLQQEESQIKLQLEAWLHKEEEQMRQEQRIMASTRGQKHQIFLHCNQNQKFYKYYKKPCFTCMRELFLILFH